MYKFCQVLRRPGLTGTPYEIKGTVHDVSSVYNTVSVVNGSRAKRENVNLQDWISALLPTDRHDLDDAVRKYQVPGTSVINPRSCCISWLLRDFVRETFSCLFQSSSVEAWH